MFFLAFLLISVLRVLSYLNPNKMYVYVKWDYASSGKLGDVSWASEGALLKLKYKSIAETEVKIRCDATVGFLVFSLLLLFQ